MVNFERRRHRKWFWLFLLLVYPTVGHAEKFTSTQGFSLEGPSGWEIASKELTQQLGESLRERLSKLKGIDLDRMAVVMFDPTDTSYQTNINVVVSPGRLPIEDSKAEDQYRSMLSTQFQQAGFDLKDIKVSRRTFGKHQVLLGEWRSNMMGELLQWQVLFPAAGKTFIVTCTSPVARFAVNEPVFISALESVDWQDSLIDRMPPWLFNVLVGAGIGALIGLFGKLLGSGKSSGGQTATPEITPSDTSVDRPSGN